MKAAIAAPAGEQASLESILERFESAWQSGNRPVLEDYVPSSSSHRRAVLVELIHADLELRIKAGEKICVEAYVERFPELATSHEELLSLITAEYGLRAQQSLGVQRDQYLQRFPKFEKELLALPGSTADGESEWPSTVETPARPTSRRDAANASMPHVTGYDMLGVLGRGGMGVVYKARQVRADRLVALKMILASGHAGASQRERFRTEAQAVARLQHPNIVQIFEVGEQAGQPFFSLEYMDAGSLASKLNGTPWTGHAAAELVETLARAMHYAHQCGIVHRDLKPANVLLSVVSSPASAAAEPKEQTMNGGPRTVAKISDFGLAKKLDDAVGQTASGHPLGTPSYMAPEQAEGKLDQLGPAADVYALGAVLYELLTGRPPFRAATVLDTLAQVLNDEPVAPSRLNSKSPRDLETICLKCLEKEPSKRYASAGELAEDLRRFRAGEPIAARPVGHIEKTWRWGKRNPVIAGLASAAAVFLIAGTVVSLVFAVRARDREELAQEKENLANESASRAQESQRKTLGTLHASRSVLAQRELQNADVVGVETLLNLQKPGTDESTDRRGWEWWYLSRLCRSNLRELDFRAQKPHGAITSVACSPDGEHIVTGDRAGWVQLFSLAEGREPARFQADKYTVQAVQFSPNGQYLATGGGEVNFQNDENSLRLWDFATRKEVRSFKGHKQVVTALAFHPDGTKLASGSRDKTVRVWDVETGKVLHQFEAGGAMRLPGLVGELAFSPDGKVLAAAAGERIIVKLWDLATGVERRLTVSHDEAINTLAFSPDGRFLATGSADSIRLSEVASGRELHVLRGHTGPLTRLAFTADGHQLISSGSDGTLRTWDVATGAAGRTVRGHQGSIRDFVVEPSGRRIISVEDHEIRLWDLRTDVDVRLTTADHTFQQGLKFSPDGTELIFPNHKGYAVWNYRPNFVRHVRPEIQDWLVQFCVALSPDGKQVVTGVGSSIKLWEAATGKPLHTFQGHKSGTDMTPIAVAFSPDGRRLAAVSSDKTLRIWDAVTGTEMQVFRDNSLQAGFRSVAYSPADGRIAAGSEKGVHIFDPEAETCMAVLGGDGFASTLVFRPGGRWLAFGHPGRAERSLRIFDWMAGSEFRDFDCPISSASDFGLAMDAEGKRLFFGANNQVRIFDIDTRMEVLTLEEKARIKDLALSPDGHFLAVRTDSYVKVYDARPMTREIEVERDAWSLVNFLASKPFLKDQVVSTIPSQRGISSDVRKKAAEFAALVPDEPERFNNAAWQEAVRPGRSPEHYQAARAHAQTACRLAPNAGWFLTTLGACEYRLGRFDEAIKTLLRSEKMNRDQLGRTILYNPSDTVYLAMAYYRQGKTKEAAAYLEQSLQYADWPTKPYLCQIMAEAKALIDGGSSKSASNQSP